MYQHTCFGQHYVYVYLFRIENTYTDWYTDACNKYMNTCCIYILIYIYIYIYWNGGINVHVPHKKLLGIYGVSNLPTGNQQILCPLNLWCYKSKITLSSELVAPITIYVYGVRIPPPVFMGSESHRQEASGVIQAVIQM